MAGAFSQLQKSSCLCLTSPVAGVCILLQQHCSSRAVVSSGIQQILNPSNCSWPQSIILANARNLFQSGLSLSRSVTSANYLVLLNSQTSSTACSGKNPMHKKIPPRQVSPHCNFCSLEKQICCHDRISDALQKELQL